jgi:type I restriction enzyme S subunit
MKLSKVFDLRNGYTPSKANSNFWENGTIPWFRLEDIKKNGRILDKAIQSVDESALKGSGIYPENSIIMSVSATIGEHALVTVPFVANQRFIILTIKSEFETKLLPKFAFYCGFDIANYCKKNTTLGNFAGVDMKKFADYEFNIPSVDYQNICIKILDEFVALIESIELEAVLRRKQFEYYSDRLFSFAELDSA